MIHGKMRLEIKVNDRQSVFIEYDTFQFSELVDPELVLQLFSDLLTHLKAHHVIKDYYAFIEKR